MKPHLRLVKSTPSESSCASTLPDVCERCMYYVAPDGCACAQIALLIPGGALHHVSARSLENMSSPHFFHDCICPDCFMTRRWDWDVSRLENVTRPPELRPGRGFTNMPPVSELPRLLRRPTPERIPHV